MDLIPQDQAGSSASDPRTLEMSPEAVKLAHIQTTRVQRQRAQAEEGSRTFSGKLQADERRVASQVAHIPGRIERLYVSFEGEAVRKGQRLVDLYSPALITAQQELREALALRDTYPDMLAAARQKLAGWKIDSARVRAMEQQAHIQEVFTLYADAAGVVTNRRVAVGDYVQQGQVLFDLTDLDRLWVQFDAYEEDLGSVQPGDQMAFTAQAFPGQRFTTRITFIDPVINPQTRVARLRGEVSNQRGRLKPEMFVRGTLVRRSSAQEGLLLPKTAVLWTGTRSVVYVKVPNTSIPSFEYREVVLGERVGDAYVVREGLEANEEVVTHGNFAIDAAAQLNNQQSMMNRLVNLPEGPEVAPDFVQGTPAAFQQSLKGLTDAYLGIKDALVQTDSSASRSASRAFLQRLEGIEAASLREQEEIHGFWQQQARAMESHAQALLEAEAVAQQRDEFRHLSNLMIETIQAMGVSGDTLYIQHCPMADDWKGADWISTEQAIRNPYFGAEMLTCGTVEGNLPSRATP